MKSLLIKPFATIISHRIRRMSQHALRDQHNWMTRLLAIGQQTHFGKDHHLDEVVSYDQYQQAVPIRDYEAGRIYYDRIVAGEHDVTWPGQPEYFAKTSGTTSGVKYIPITKESMPNHISTAQKALLNYASQGNRSRLFDGKVMFLSGSPILTDTNGVKTGRLSGIVNHEIPTWIKSNQLPHYDTNCIDDWEQKVDQIVKETKGQDLRLISGIPPWVQMYFERLLDATGCSTVKDVFPNLQLFMYGGVNYEPYRQTMEQLTGERIDSIEVYPASEGFIAFQDSRAEEGLLLNTNSGIFFEFIPLSEFYHDNPLRISLKEVQVGIDYVLIINNNAGLWGYNLGDTVRFVSLDPYRLVVSGRVKHFISAFGEHVIAKEVEEAMRIMTKKYGCTVREFTVAPRVNPSDGGVPYHEWYVEFEQLPITDLEQLAATMDHSLCSQNIYYRDLIEGQILRRLVIRPVAPDTFRQVMKQSGKLGGQNKVPRLSNDRQLADQIEVLNAGLIL